MNIDPLVIFGAVVWFTAYLGTLAVIFWRTRKVSQDVVASAGRIERNAEAHFKRMETALQSKIDEMPTQDMVERLNALSTKFTEVADNIPDFDQDAVFARLDELEQRLPDMIATHVNMAIKNIQAQEAKQVSKYIEDMGIEAATDEAKQAIIERLTGRQQFAVRLMQAKIPKSVRDQNPALAWLLDQTKVAAGQYLLEMGGNGETVLENASQPTRYSPGR
jgi:DNA anti-recombination protein RmuC